MEIFSYPFMQNAFLAGTIVAIVAGIMGVFVIARGLTFVTHTFADIGFSGASVAGFFGWNPFYGLLLFSISGALIMAQIGLKVFRKEIAGGLLLTFFLGLGMLFLSISDTQISYIITLLFGSFFGISREQAFILLGLSLVVLIFLALGYRMLLFDTFDPVGAEAKGLPTRFISTAFLLLLAITVVGAMQLVGTLLVFSLAVIPAAAARLLSDHIPKMMLYSAILALAGVWGGLFLGYYTNASVTFFITTLETLFYAAASIFQKYGLSNKAI